MLRIFLMVSTLTIASVSQAYMTAMPGFVDFGNVRVGQAQYGNTTISNMSNKSLQVAISQFGCEDIQVFSTCGMISAYGSCGISLQFAPTSPGHKSCQLMVHAFGSGEQAMIQIEGDAVAAE